MEKPELMKYWNAIYFDLCKIAGEYHIDRTGDFRKCFDFAEENSIIGEKEIRRHIKRNSFMRHMKLRRIAGKVKNLFKSQ